MQRAAPPLGVKEVPSHPSQEMAEYEQDRDVCEGYKRKSDIGIVKSNEYQKRSSSGSFLILVTFKAKDADFSSIYAGNL